MQGFERGQKQLNKGFNLFIINHQVTWEIWKYRNYCVFSGVNPDVATVVRAVTDQCILWCAAGSKDLQGLVD